MDLLDLTSLLYEFDARFNYMNIERKSVNIERSMLNIEWFDVQHRMLLERRLLAGHCVPSVGMHN